MDIILDFDGTITAVDTIGVLGSLGASRQRSKLEAPSRATTCTAEKTPAEQDPAAVWDWIVAEYVNDFREHVGAYEPREADRSTAEAEAAFLVSIAAVDSRSLRRVAGSGIFAGVTEQHLFDAGREAVRTGKVPVRTGFAEFVAAAAAKGAKLSVISVNWSASFIRGVLAECCGASEAAVIADIVSNEITASGEIRAAGPAAEVYAEAEHAALTTSRDKLNALLDRPPITASREEPHAVFYFGDSPTDLECLLAASAGVVMADDPAKSGLLQTLSRLGHEVPHALDAPRATSLDCRIVWARNFREILNSSFADGTVRPPPVARPSATSNPN